MRKKLKEIQDESNRKYVESIAGFDGTELLFASGYKLTINLSIVNISIDHPHGYSYAFNLFAPDSDGNPTVRILATDNAHAPLDSKHPHDHWHDTKFGPGGFVPIGVKKAKSIEMNNIEQHIGKFIRESEILLMKLGQPVDIIQMNIEKNI
ncbi:hypothetical protein [Polynucleobacter kasalickyi]|uniref:Uncharacterized protein n=1 Tax=Polynucleobacter kasalickyi TaxID=1938817 RepID=A0A1W2A7V2_9BURK|nr:hypothetical protein [Polynucleobacter kasalickyi]SMC56795.1 hypothetical protein SAMN06296008_10817 [Polynucleobacter kasalickyi]